MLRFLAVLFLISVGCGTGATGTEDVVEGPFEAGELDPYGCPFVDPVPWEGSEAHQEVCGPGCEPFAAWQRGGDNSFVACVAEEVPRPSPGEADIDVVWCMVHPVNGERYCRGSPQSAYPFFYLCWSYSDDNRVFEYPPTAPPKCLETPFGASTP